MKKVCMVVQDKLVKGGIASVISGYYGSRLEKDYKMIYVESYKDGRKVEKLVKKFKTRDPFEILEEMNVIVGETDRYEKLKGYCFMSCQTIYVMVSSFLSEEEKKIVAAHELGHIILHRSQLKMAPMKDDVLYNMRDNTEYEANLFAADLILDDKEIADLSKNEDLNYFGLCSCLNSSPELMSFKLYSLIKRGQNYNMPLEIQSNFLAK